MSARLIDALALPPDVRVDRRVPKKLFLEHGAPTPADKRRIQDGIEEALWIAALKPSNIGVPAFRDDAREYLEIAVVSVVLRAGATTARLVELLHRAVAYPLVLISAQEGTESLSLAHKRHSQGEGGKTVTDPVECAILPISTPLSPPETAFVECLALSAQPASDLFTLYQSWLDRITALAASHITGRFVPATSPEAATARRGALEERAKLLCEIAGFRAQAERESQLNRRVELNLKLRRLQEQLAEADRLL